MPQRADSATTELTGNHYLSFPQISKADGGIVSVSALNAELGGIIAWDGDPLLRVKYARPGGEPQPLTNLKWDRFERWIPHARTEIDASLAIEVTICAPSGYEPVARGGFIVCEVQNRGTTQLELDLILDARVTGTSLQIVGPRALHGDHRLMLGAMHRGIAFEAGAPTAVAALGITAEDADAQYRILNDAGERSDVGDRRAAAGELLNAEITMRVRIRPGRSVRRAFFLGVGRDTDSALGHSAHLARVGAAPLLRDARLELAHIARRTGDVQISELINRNLLFNHFFGLARAFDDDRLYAMSSRSPQHLPGAALNEREVLFWTLPCVTLTDPLLARELLRDSFEIYSAQPGLQWRYLDGGVIEPGFCLEQVLLYPLAVDRYVRETGDDSILDDPLIQDVLREIDGGLESRLHPDLLLCSTEVLPDGEPADHPYPTLGNVLLWAYAEALPRLWRGDDAEAPAVFDGASEDIASAIWQRCMADLEGAQIFVSTTDLEKNSAVYDDPLMSLSLISFFGFCKTDDPTLRDTIALLRSKDFPFWLGGAAPGLSSRAIPGTASLAALCGDMLGARRDAALQTLRTLQLTDGLACDRYDPATGRTAAGPHAAALAGLLAWTLVQAVDGPATGKRKETAKHGSDRKERKSKK